VKTYVAAGQRSWDQHEHFWWNNGYAELNYGLYPVHDKDAFDGPFKVPGSTVTPLVIGTTYDPATPYRGAKNLVRTLGNARLLTMRGDGPHRLQRDELPDVHQPRRRGLRQRRHAARSGHAVPPGGRLPGSRRRAGVRGAADREAAPARGALLIDRPTCPAAAPRRRGGPR
jgi:hypothetical protein